MTTIIGHEALVRELRALAASPEPPHALLFAGPDSIGRAALAMEYARLLNCTGGDSDAVVPGLFGSPGGSEVAHERPCGNCRACRLIAEGAHPDVITVGPGDTLCRPRNSESGHERHPLSRDIRICQVRGVIDLVAKYPFEARYRAIIIDPADRMNREAANTLLKTLEEPPGHTVFLLISSAPESLLETVISRCRRMDVRTVPRESIEAGLRERQVPPDLAKKAAHESRGRPGRALAFAKQPDLMDDRERLLGRCARIASQRMSERLSQAEGMAERWRKDRSLLLGELDAWEAYWEERLHDAAQRDDRSSVATARTALEAVTLGRADLQANVQVRPAMELMLLSFPRVTLHATTSEEESATHA
jgi:DNA polymerase-3 subunit delta'